MAPRSWMRDSSQSPPGGAVYIHPGSGADAATPTATSSVAVAAKGGLIQEDSCSVVSVSEMYSDSPYRATPPQYASGTRVPSGTPQSYVAAEASSVQLRGESPPGRVVAHPSAKASSVTVATHASGSEQSHRRLPAPRERVVRTQSAECRDMITVAQHDRILNDLRRVHSEEVRLSDAVHARHCADVAGAVEELRASRNKYRERCDALVQEIEQAKKRYTVEKTVNEDLESMHREKTAAERRAREMLADADGLRAENGRLKFELERMYSLAKTQEQEARRAFDDVQADHEQLAIANRDLAARLQEATQDFKEMERNQLLFREQAQLGKTRYATVTQDLKRKEEHTARMKSHAEKLKRQFEKLVQRVSDRAAAARNSTAPKDTKNDVEALQRPLQQLFQMVDHT
eukprot:Rhum_TRINITY_DN9418_c0_g2::Rhum_TRINITY_DN9418_c0_g2_i2::g.33419::m.33419